MSVPKFFSVSTIAQERAISGEPFREFLRAPSMSAGLYFLSAGSTDLQKPHDEDELYYVIRGRGRMRVGSEEQPIHAGTIIFVEAHVEHRFLDIEEDLEVLVFFAPAESGDLPVKSKLLGGCDNSCRHGVFAPLFGRDATLMRVHSLRTFASTLSATNSSPYERISVP